MSEYVAKRIGERVRTCRKLKNLKLDQFAEIAGISWQFLAEIEKGKKNMSAETLFKICDRHHLSPNYILFGKFDAEHLSDPIKTLLDQFSTPYWDFTGDVIQAMSHLVKTSEDQKPTAE